VPPEPFLKRTSQELFEHAEWGGPLGRAHEYFRKGNFDEALKEYSRVRQLANASTGNGDDRLLKQLNDYLQEQMVLVRQVQEGAEAIASVRGAPPN